MPKYLDPSFEIIGKIETKANYKCKSKTPELEFSGDLSKSEDEYFFSGFMESRARNNKWDFKNVSLNNTNIKLFTSKLTITRTERLEATDNAGIFYDKVYGNINFLSFNKKENKKLYRRVAIPVGEDIRFSNYLVARSFETEHNRIIGRAFVEVIIGNIEFDFFIYKRNLKQYLLIDSKSPVTYKSFYDYVYAIILSYGFITGNLPYGQAYYLSSEDRNFKNIKNVIFQTLQSSISSSYGTIYANSHAFRSRISKKKADYYYPKLKEIDVQTFSNICSNIHKHEPLLRSVILILMANTFEIFTASAMYNVVLETLSKYFGEIKGDSIRPIQDRHTWRNLRGGFINALNEVRTEISTETYEYFINKKINNLNSPGNRDMLSLQFSSNGITLSAEEEKIIDQRNTFLHGGHPLSELKKDYNTDRFGLLYYILLRLHFMINRLLLKHFGYDGYMLNHVKLNQKITKIKVTEEPFIKV